MSQRTCSIDGCHNKPIGRGLCNTHYRRWRRHGDPLKTVRKPRQGRICKIENCELPVEARELCKSHYYRWKTYGDPLYRRPLAKDQPCGISGCRNKVHALGYCNLHYKRNLIHGDPLTLVRFEDAEAAFAARTKWDGDCLRWQGETTPAGYGRLYVNGQRRSVHRYAWERKRGRIPEGKMIDHVCFTRDCVNLAHLRLATSGQNSAHKSGPSAVSSSGVRNVHKYEDKWRVNVMKNGKSNYFGVFDSVEEASVVAQRAREDLFGPYAGLG